MQFAVTVPQIFFDLISRLMPGALFLFFIKLTFIEKIDKLTVLLPSNIWLKFIALFVISYFIGWILKALTFFSKQDAGKLDALRENFSSRTVWKIYSKLLKKSKTKYSDIERKNENEIQTFFALDHFINTRKLEEKERTKRKYELDKTSQFLSSIEQKIRIENAEVGFRLVKLRAEARMLGGLRSGLILLLPMLTITSLVTIPDDFTKTYFLILSIQWFSVIIFIISCLKIERSRWKHYYSNIIKINDVI